MSNDKIKKLIPTFVCVKPREGSELLYKYPEFLSKKEKETFEEHVKVCKKCQQDFNILKIAENDFRKYGKKICQEKFLNSGTKFLSKKKYKQAAKSFEHAIEIEPEVAIKLWKDKDLVNQLISQCPEASRGYFITEKGIWSGFYFSPETEGRLMRQLLKTVYKPEETRRHIEIMKGLLVPKHVCDILYRLGLTDKNFETRVTIEDLRIIQSSLNKLTQKERLILTCLYLKNMSLKEISQMLRYSPSKVVTLLACARRKIAKRLGLFIKSKARH